MNRDKYLAWCKARALTFLDRGELADALDSMLSDLGKNPETAGHPGITLGALMMLADRLKTAEDMRKFIDGFR